MKNLIIPVVSGIMFLSACGTDTTSFRDEGNSDAKEFIELYNKKGVSSMQLQGALIKVKNKEAQLRDNDNRAAANAYIKAFTETLEKEDSTAFNEIIQP